MKAIDYLHAMDLVMDTYREIVEKDGINTSWLRGYTCGRLYCLREVAMQDSEITPVEFDEIINQQREYEREVM